MEATIYKRQIRRVTGDGSIYLGSETSVICVLDDKHNKISVDISNPRILKRLLKDMGYTEVKVAIERKTINRSKL